MQDPKIVITSILDSEKKDISKNIAVYPVSIRRYALLEIIKSPFLDTSVKFEINSVIPSAFIFTHTADELKVYSSTNIEKLYSDAMTWADDNLTLEDMPKLITEIVSQM